MYVEIRKDISFKTTFIFARLHEDQIEGQEFNVQFVGDQNAPLFEEVGSSFPHARPR